jgi:hypothetical protein
MVTIYSNENGKRAKKDKGKWLKGFNNGMVL